MAYYGVPVWVTIPAFMVVEASSKREAIEKAKKKQCFDFIHPNDVSFCIEEIKIRRTPHNNNPAIIREITEEEVRFYKYEWDQDRGIPW